MRRGGRSGGLQGRIGSIWKELNTSFWFLPSLMSVGSVLLFVATLQLDRLVQASLSDLPVIFSGGLTPPEPCSLRWREAS